MRFQYTAKNMMSTVIWIAASLDDNVEKLRQVFQVTSKWKKDANILHYKFL